MTWSNSWNSISSEDSEEIEIEPFIGWYSISPSLEIEITSGLFGKS
jgi:hypothetical protein